MALNTTWKTENYKFVGKTFDFAYADRLNKLLPIIGEVKTNSIDYELTGTGGYGEMAKYDGSNLVMRAAKCGFKTVVTPEEYNLSDQIGYEKRKTGKQRRAGDHPRICAAGGAVVRDRVRRAVRRGPGRGKPAVGLRSGGTDVRRAGDDKRYADGFRADYSPEGATRGN